MDKQEAQELRYFVDALRYFLKLDPLYTASSKSIGAIQWAEKNKSSATELLDQKYSVLSDLTKGRW